jgi:HTH-type transcriptional regulator/antitoxin HigA
MVDATVREAEQGWPAVGKILYVPHDEAEYDRLVRTLDQLVDEIGEDEKHPLASLMEVIGVLIEKYEDDHVPELDNP